MNPDITKSYLKQQKKILHSTGLIKMTNEKVKTTPHVKVTLIYLQICKDKQIFNK